MAHNKHRLKSKRTQARDDARSFEKFIAAHNEALAQREAEETQPARADAEEFENYFTKRLFYGRIAAKEDETC